jgi:hypothetical protein
VAVNHISRKKYPCNWKIGIYRTDNAGGLGSKVNGGSPRPWNIAKFSEFYLVAAEAAVKLNMNAEAVEMVNVLRERAGKQTYCVNARAPFAADHSAEMLAATPRTITIDYILDERSRELYYEGFRRTDLIRYGYFGGENSSKYLWEWKGGVKNGQGFEAFRNIFAIPYEDKNANPNIEQNIGYN